MRQRLCDLVYWIDARRLIHYRFSPSIVSTVCVISIIGPDYVLAQFTICTSRQTQTQIL